MNSAVFPVLTLHFSGSPSVKILLGKKFTVDYWETICEVILGNIELSNI